MSAAGKDIGGKGLDMLGALRASADGVFAVLFHIMGI